MMELPKMSAQEVLRRMEAGTVRLVDTGTIRETPSSTHFCTINHKTMCRSESAE